MNSVWRITGLFALIWTLIVSGIAIWTYREKELETIEHAEAAARTLSNQIQKLRSWATSKNGVYVEMTPDSAAEDSLSENREAYLEMQSGRKLKRLDPAQLVRSVMDSDSASPHIRGHLRGMVPLHEANAPDGWERSALEQLHLGEPEVMELTEIGNAPFLRLMQPILTEEECLECHTMGDYKVGEVLGGICVAVPLAPLIENAQPAQLRNLIGYSSIWALGIIGIYLAGFRINQQMRQEQAANRTLRALIEGTSGVTGKGCYDRVVNGLAELFRAESVMLGELVNTSSVRSLAVNINGESVSELTYDLAGTPSEHILQNGMPVLFSSVKSQFPRDEVLRKHDIEDWAGTPIHDREGKILGLLWAASSKKLDTPPIWKDILRSLAARASAEIERDRTEGVAIDREEWFRTLVEYSTDWIWAIDEKGSYTYSSPTVEQITGYRPEELVGKTPLDFTPAEENERIGERFRQLLNSGGSITGYESPFLHKSGRVLSLETNGVRILGPKGEFQGYRGVTRDITVRKEAEAERLYLERRSQQFQKLSSLGAMAGGIAHDFNNILTAILGNAELALYSLPEGSPALENLKQVQSSALRAAELARQMLVYSGKGIHKSGPVDLNRLVLESTKGIEASVSEAIQFHFDLAGYMTPFEGASSEIGEVVENLVRNAVDAIGDSQGNVWVKTGIITCSRKFLDEIAAASPVGSEDPVHPGPYVYIKVKDDGEGMGSDVLARVFDPFFTTRFPGRGLGMSAVLGIVRGHNGAIHLKSREGEGTEILVLFPAFNPRSSASDNEVFPSDDKEWRCLGTALIADDENTVRSIGRKFLERLGFEVIEASNGQEALLCFEHNADRINLVLLDLTMPIMGGDKAFERMRKLRPEIAVILCSGYSEEHIAARFKHEGPAGFLQKPYSSDTLRNKIRQVLPC